MKSSNKHLYNLNELSDYKISDGYPDVRGWEVRDIDNRVVGKVDNLLVNKESQRVVYLDVEVDKSIIDANHDPYAASNDNIREFVNKDGDNHLIVPIGLVNLNESAKQVVTDTINHRTFAETKRYHKGDELDRSYEVQVLDSYGRSYKGSQTNIADTTARTSYAAIDNEDRIRELIREEIRIYHNDKSDYQSTLTDEDLDLERRRRNTDIDDDDDFYERREFENRHFKKRTPGL